MAQRPKLTRTQVRYLERAERIRRKLSNKALAAKFGLTPTSIRHYLAGNSIALEDWRDRRADKGFKTY